MKVSIIEVKSRSNMQTVTQELTSNGYDLICGNGDKRLFFDGDEIHVVLNTTAKYKSTEIYGPFSIISLVITASKRAEEHEEYENYKYDYHAVGVSPQYTLYQNVLDGHYRLHVKLGGWD